MSDSIDAEPLSEDDLNAVSGGVLGSPRETDQKATETQKKQEQSKKAEKERLVKQAP